MDDKKKQFLEAMQITEEFFDSMPFDTWFMGRGLSPEKARLAFKCVEAPINFGDWTAITLSKEAFLKVAVTIPELAKQVFRLRI